MPKKQTAQVDPIIARRARVSDNLSRRRMAVKLAHYVEGDNSLDGEVWEWLTLVTRTEAIQGYELPSPDEPAETIWAKFETYLQMDGLFAEQWDAKVKAANEPQGERAFFPPEYLTPDEKKSTPRDEEISDS